MENDLDAPVIDQPYLVMHIWRVMMWHGGDMGICRRTQGVQGSSVIG